MSEVIEIVDENTNETFTIEEIVESLATDEAYSAYGVHVIINKSFQVLEIDKQIIPQMMYNYSRNGMIAKKDMEVNEKGKKINKDHTYTQAEVRAFVTKYVSKHTK